MIFNESKYNEHWDTKPLNDLGTFNRGKSKHRPRNDKKLFEDGKYPLIQTAEVKAATLHINEATQFYGDFGLAQSKIWDKGTLCITIAANIAETGILNKPMCFPDSVVGFKAYPDVSSELYMHYIFAYIKQSIQNSINGSIQDNINIDYLSKLKFKIPKKDYQDKIVELLASIDNKIETNLEIDKNIHSMLRMLYDYWFLQFDFPNGDVPYCTSGGEMKSVDDWKEDIPKDFDVQTLAEFVTLANEKIDPSKNPKQTYKHYSIPEYDKCGSFAKELGETIKSNKSVVNANQILVSKLNPWFNRVILPVDEENTIASTEFIIWNSENKWIQNYLYVVSKHPHFIDYCTDKATGTSNSHKRVDPEVMLKFSVCANKDIIEKFGQMIEPYISIIKSNVEEKKKLINLRDFLLPLLMNGQVGFKRD